MDAAVRAFFAEMVPDLLPLHRVVEFGSRNVNGTVKDLFVGSDYWGIDLLPGRDVDEVADAADWEPEHGFMDAVVCTSLLEHCPYPARVIQNAGRILRDQGLLFVTVPITGYPPHGVDGGPVGEEYYRNRTVMEMMSWLAEDFNVFARTGERGQMFVAAVRKPR